jgi:hypothetical protein
MLHTPVLNVNISDEQLAIENDFFMRIYHMFEPRSTTLNKSRCGISPKMEPIQKFFTGLGGSSTNCSGRLEPHL